MNMHTLHLVGAGTEGCSSIGIPLGNSELKVLFNFLSPELYKIFILYNYTNVFLGIIQEKFVNQYYTYLLVI